MNRDHCSRIQTFNIILAAALLSIVQSFSMDLPVQDDDARDWFTIQSFEDTQKFAGKIVGYQTSFADNMMSYGLIPAERCACAEPCLLYFLASRNNQGFYPLPMSALQKGSWRMRLLNLDEICHFNNGFKAGKIFCPEIEDGFENFFKLGNLLEREREHYFRGQVCENMWEWQRLLILGKKDEGSLLYMVPKDMLHLIMQEVIEAQVEDLMRKTDLEEPLVLE
jgi:hypothetical protein